MISHKRQYDVITRFCAWSVYELFQMFDSLMETFCPVVSDADHINEICWIFYLSKNKRPSQRVHNINAASVRCIDVSTTSLRSHLSVWITHSFLVIFSKAKWSVHVSCHFFNKIIVKQSNANGNMLLNHYFGEAGHLTDQSHRVSMTSHQRRFCIQKEILCFWNKRHLGTAMILIINEHC